MRYETVKELKDVDFKRSTGVSREMFEKMLVVLQKEMRDFGRPPKLARTDQLLMTLMYWREYRTEFHIGISYGVSEATVCRTIQKVENVLMKSGEFRLPGRKALQPSDTLIEVVLIDVTDSRSNGRKKATPALHWQKEASHPENTVDRRPKDAGDHCHSLCQWKLT
jgi:hypothetical protein